LWENRKQPSAVKKTKGDWKFLDSLKIQNQASMTLENPTDLFNKSDLQMQAKKRKIAVQFA
jgi:hypothetical protein